jgi:hypothetical protein
LQTLVSLLVGGILFVAVSKLLKIKELDYFMRAFKNKIFPSKNLNGYDRDQIGGIK